MSCNVACLKKASLFFFLILLVQLLTKKLAVTFGQLESCNYFYSVEDNVVDLSKRSAYICQDSPKDESGLLKAVQNVHSKIDKEIAAGVNPNNIFVCGFSQGGFSFVSRVYK